MSQPEFDEEEEQDEDYLQYLTLMRPEHVSSSDNDDQEENEQDSEEDSEDEDYVPEDDQLNKEIKRAVRFSLLDSISDEDDSEDDSDYMDINDDDDDDDDNDDNIYDDEDDDEDEEEEDDDDDERETITGQPRYANYLSDLLGPDLPDEDEDDEFEQMSDDYGTLAFRDPTDNDLLGGFELRHFNLVPNYPGFEEVNLREQEETVEDTLLHDNIAKGLINALLNSGDEIQMKQGRDLLKKLKKQCKARKNM
ncbi:hypothetical protein G6F46_004303 [Rhizopus delemar]|nr:hypothetical protein G6F55_006908 [Rhizopus delemar]KAG1540889.1 hypothetical protein G6F51_008251 [Rhizopus arrhizus]KAG1490177.1 hypothetical protein G6F54_010914 [Rhizopus delemar]KAG1518841.1 hypothetical protein G6F52_008948 [Rhizopus delemar]KAG1551195.1 hypothetical protein G6F49_009060 [Rhizopus delemar]